MTLTIERWRLEWYEAEPGTVSSHDWKVRQHFADTKREAVAECRQILRQRRDLIPDTPTIEAFPETWGGFVWMPNPEFDAFVMRKVGKKLLILPA